MGRPLPLRATIHLGSGEVTREPVLGEPIQVADGALERVEVSPAPLAAGPIAPGEYHFAFRFDGGL